MKTFRAFTMIELIFIIVIGGILAAFAIPRMERNGLIEAADQLSSHIRYAQQLAMNDNRFAANENFWHRKLWQIHFEGTRYYVYSDRNVNNKPNDGATEVAIDPMNPAKLLISDGAGTTLAQQNKKLDLKHTYSITNVALGGSCAGKTHIGFDYKGRPMEVEKQNLYASMYTTTCTITLTNEAGQTATIFVQPETGYVGATSTQSPNGDILYDFK